MAADMHEGYHSATAYHFHEEQADAIIRTSAYHRRDYDLAVVWLSPHQHSGIRSSIATPFRTSSARGLGSLDKLPRELLYDVLFRLDMRSLLRLRQTSLVSRETVDSLKQYQLVVSHGLNLFCVLLRTRLADNVSLLDFYNALLTKDCVSCGEFSGFISLLTWKRCCFSCLQTAPELQVQTLAAARKHLRPTKSQSAHWKTFKTLPDIYTMEERAQRSRVVVICVPQAKSVITEDASASWHIDDSSRNKTLNFMGTVALPFYDKVADRVESGLSCAGCQLATEKYIIGSAGEEWAFDARDKVFSRDGFLQHFISWCEQAQLLWRSSGDGLNQPSELPEGARRGGYFNPRE